MKKAILILAILLLTACSTTPDYCKTTAERPAGTVAVERCVNWEIRGSTAAARKFRQDARDLGLAQ